MKRIFLIVFLSFFFVKIQAQSNSPLREMRAVWVATVSNLDWPHVSERGDADAQKRSYIALLDSLQRVNLNTVFLQVRTECDAFYDSAYEPWSRYLTSVQGLYPGYDPLAFALEETHKRGMELHAWLNPYRVNVSTNDGGSYYGEGHVYLEHPEWMLEYTGDGGKKILNPGLPQVQHYIKEVVGDLISKYDIDGIHFDDYFYAYGGTPAALDQEAYELYGQENESIGDFRRRSINQMVSQVWDTIQDTKPYIRFGISPFGIYGNGMNPPGIIGLDAYNTIYCDPLAWLSEGTVDYINPQLYWPTGGDQDFSILLPWWADKAGQYDRHVYAGHGIYRLNTNPGFREEKLNRIIQWFKDKFRSKIEQSRVLQRGLGWDLDEVVTQIEIVRENAWQNALGSVYFRANDFNRIIGLKEKLLDEVYSSPSVFPEMTWKAGDAPNPPLNVKFNKDQQNGTYILSWDHPVDTCRFMVFATDNNAPDQLFEAYQLAGITYDKEFSPDANTRLNGDYVAVKSLDRYSRESELSALYEIPSPEKVSLISPLNGFNLVGIGEEFKWRSAPNSSYYQIEFSGTSDFSTDTYSFFVSDTSFILENLDLTGELSYFWRVSGFNLGSQGEYSEIWSFESAAPRIPVVIHPQNNDQEIDLHPDILFDASAGSDSVRIQISKGGSGFADYRIVLDTTVYAQNESCFLQDPLAEYTTHYLRMRSQNQYGISSWTTVVKFKTLKTLPAKPIVFSPFNEELFPNIQSEISIKWNELDDATSYELQIADDVGFTEILVTKSFFGDTSFLYEDPRPDNWHFIRVAGKNVGGLGEWSETVKFGLGDPSNTKTKLYEKNIRIYPNPSSSGVFKIKTSGIPSGNLIAFLFNDAGQLLSNRIKINIQEEEAIINLSKYDCSPCLLVMIDPKGNHLITRKLFSFD